MGDSTGQRSLFLQKDSSFSCFIQDSASPAELLFVVVGLKLEQLFIGLEDCTHRYPTAVVENTDLRPDVTINGGKST